MDTDDDWDNDSEKSEGDLTIPAGVTMTIEVPTKINMELKDTIKTKFQELKTVTGIEANTELVRHCITLARWHYRPRGGTNPYFK